MKCGRDGCDGEIVDGYCDVCGMAPVPGPRPPAGATVAPDAASFAVTATSLRRSQATRARTSARSRLGAGLVEVPAMPYRDPADAVMAKATVAEGKRFCSNPRCGAPVGRPRDGAAGRAEGF